MSQTVAVLDIGKTNVKLALFDEGRLLWEKSAPNRVLPGSPYPHEDVESGWSFFLDALREAARTHRIGAIVPTAHGAAGALIGESNLAAPVMDYEFKGIDEIEPDYAKLRPPFSQSLSPKLPAGLNLGRQLAYQKWRCPDLFAKAKHFVGYPQYWAWRLSGVAVSEVTTLGAHGDLWLPRQGQVSSLVGALDVGHLLPPMRRAFDPLGPIQPDIAAATGLAPETPVFCGIHDSNASLLPYLVSRQAPFTVLSTGTWVILMSVGLSLDQLDPRDDTLANVDVLGRPIACGRFMGGREYAVIAGGGGNPDIDAIERVIASGTIALPCFSGQGGPYATTEGVVRGEVAARDRAALATLYCALVSDLLLTRMGATIGDLIVEGTFARNRPFCQTLGALRPTQRVFGAEDAAGTARGAAMLAQWPPSYLIAEPSPIAPISISGLDSYRKAWTATVDRIV
ncbi:sugar kinase [Bradyrhizobium sp. WYCCWR 13023]|uniref:Sugar kinase n=1 Tax=Bradyrhizobium zhengyangense TaxID=2911009 RepID=A0A9X1U967_9BRAD|nr:FGGY family carbohydrate kinase [Bradyrhizobium zhengyangense]MCG2626683.1 sugar kinase [Bradyrhizobium zhengyangense]MCG2638229.1 sugar kinase [Bradyrhizobium zhengyangense]MCG2666628.1 sugar kinase [Bradyrhizobium zhengyangense]